MRFSKKITACLLAGSLCMGAALLSVEAEQRELSEKLIRLHVIAASNSEEDQAVKLQVRDAVLAALPREGWQSRAQAETELRAMLPDLRRAAEAELLKNGFSCPVAAELTQEQYPTRNYENFSLPAGEYLSLRIVLGEGEGKNWWCVVYPSFCLIGPTQEVATSAGFTAGELSLITEDTASVRIRFRLLELLRSVRFLGQNRKQ